MAVIARARALRKRLTPAEARLWIALRRLRGEGLHFRRQAPMRGYILDFACMDRLLIVEVDGASHQHEDRQRQDRVRDAVLARDGYFTLRFTNEAVRDSLDEIIQTVRMRCLARPTRLSRCDSPPPRDGEGESP